MKKLSTALVLFILAFNLTASAQAKGDPWIFQVYKELYARQPSTWELNIHNYNDGSWNNYNELKKYVQDYQNNLKNQGVQVKEATLKNKNAVVGFYSGGQQVAINVISNDGGSIIASGGGNVMAHLVASGGGNLVASGGGNLVASGGGNLVASGGGNIAVSQQLKGAAFSNKASYKLTSSDAKPITTSGNGQLLFK